MTIDALLILIGALTALFAVLPRFPEPWQSGIFFILGAAVIALGVVVRRRLPTVPRQARGTFSEQIPESIAHEEAA